LPKWFWIWLETRTPKWWSNLSSRIQL